MISADRPHHSEMITRSGETSQIREKTTRSRSFSEEKTARARDRPNARESAAPAPQPTDSADPATPIGIFDSGVGGLTVARAVLDQLPAERIRYVGDTARTPYGPRPIAQVREYAMSIMDDLVASGVKLLVVACNTASAACLRDARERYPVPVVEVIVPAVRRAVHTTRSGRIGVIGTEGTIRSRAYEDAFAAARDVRVTSVACPQFADFVERGITSGRQVLGLAQAYLEPLHRADVDTVVLGCTHYPLLTGVIQLVMGDSVTLVSSAEETAKDVLRVLTELDLLASPGLAPAQSSGLASVPLADLTPARSPGSPPEGLAPGQSPGLAPMPGPAPGQGWGPSAGSAPVHEFHSTGPAQPFAKLAQRFLGPSVPSIRDSLAPWPPQLVPS
jgi:glutamate racemase